MRGSNIIILLIVIVIINAGISLVLINQFGGKNLANYHRPSSDKSIANALGAERENAITNAVAAIEPAVVSVNVIKTEIVRPGGMFGGYFFNFFDFAPLRREVQSIGSGVVFDENGHVITNAHVVKGATQIKIVLPDRREFDASLVGMDDNRDIAVLKMRQGTGAKIPFARLGNSKDIIIGEWSIAVGNPYGFLMNDCKPSVSVGVISALNRNFNMRDSERQYLNMIQTDAAINPGNSGGPLVNINGEVIGINTFIFSDSGGSVGIGFAIPIDTVKESVDKITGLG